MQAGDAKQYYDTVYYENLTIAPGTIPYDAEMPLLRTLSISTYTTMMKGIVDFWDIGGGKVLDVGCGLGLFLDLSADRGAQPYGADISLKALAEATRRSPRAKLTCAVSEALPFADSTFDYVSHIGSLEHYSDPGKAVEETIRVARPGATFMIVVPNTFFWGACLSNIGSGLPPEERRRHTEQIIELTLSYNEWSHWLEEHGLRVIRARKVPLPLDEQGYDYDSLRSVVVDHFIPLPLAWQFAFLCGPREEDEPPNKAIDEPATGQQGHDLLEQVIADMDRWVRDRDGLPGNEVIKDGIEYVRYLERYLRVEPETP